MAASPKVKIKLPAIKPLAKRKSWNALKAH
jgi:hypothetical protein